MKTIRLIDSIPLTSMQRLDDSMYEILKGIDIYNSSVICDILDGDNDIEEIENKLIDQFHQALRETLTENGYSDLLTENKILVQDAASHYVRTFVIN
ncbi:hypothetical protein [Sphingobacterium thalpophilum]|uniref:hypothetical protein n=1 Tax=Sphingobacterium thalpophilum TaxID=259 RepID=UPI002D7748DD|nr:hypothetical protein [Sphingobacterium thalpophilum]